MNRSGIHQESEPPDDCDVEKPAIRADGSVSACLDTARSWRSSPAGVAIE
jgi:hypothetical protein